MTPNVIDLFCGAGGLSFGMHQAGANIVAGFDNNKDALKTFSLNHKHSSSIYADLSEPITNSCRFPSIDLVVGGPPCQGFSISGKRDPLDVRNQLYKIYYSTLSKLRPKMFILENVPNMVSMEKGLFKDKVIKELEKIGYKISYQILTASDFGIPQKRRRVFFFGCRDKVFHVKNRDYAGVTTKDAISDLPDNTLEDGSEYPNSANSEYQKLMRSNSTGVYNHELTAHTNKTKEIIALVPDGGNYKNLPPDLRETRKVNIAWTRFDSMKPSHTIDTGHRHHFHYKFNRVPTVRESARLQSFPDSFVFLGSKTSQYVQVGNAVPPLLAQEIFYQAKELKVL